MTRNVTITSPAEARARAMDAAVQRALTDYRMAGFPRPFKGGAARYNHLFRAGENLSLCEGLAVARPDRLRPAIIGEVDCVACLAVLTERVRP